MSFCCASYLITFTCLSQVLQRKTACLSPAGCRWKICKKASHESKTKSASEEQPLQKANVANCRLPGATSLIKITPVSQVIRYGLISQIGPTLASGKISSFAHVVRLVLPFHSVCLSSFCANSGGFYYLKSYLCIILTFCPK